MLALKIEVKNRENQRLSMQNEQLQFRLQSHPNLSIHPNGENSFNTSNTSFLPYDEQQQDPCASHKCKRASTMRDSSYLNDCCLEQTTIDHQSSATSSPTPPVKLRSKSFKTQQSAIETSNKKSSYSRQYNHNYRPVSEMYDINLNDRDTLMTRSYTTATNNQITNANVNNEDNLDQTIDITNEMNSARCVSSSSSSSISHLDINSHVEDQMTKSCCMLKEGANDNESGEQSMNSLIKDSLNANSSKNYFTKMNNNNMNSINNNNNNDNSLSSSSSVSINENSVIILD